MENVSEIKKISLFKNDQGYCTIDWGRGTYVKVVAEKYICEEVLSESKGNNSNLEIMQVGDMLRNIPDINAQNKVQKFLHSGNRMEIFNLPFK